MAYLMSREEVQNEIKEALDKLRKQELEPLRKEIEELKKGVKVNGMG